MNSKLRKKLIKSLEKIDKIDAKRRENEPAATTDNTASVSGIETAKNKTGLMSKMFGNKDE